jgi:ion channel POLLUX/CASTOR
MRQDFRLPSKLRYKLDQTLSKGIIVHTLWLGVVAVVAVILLSALIWAAGLSPSESAGGLLWTTLMHVIDPGTITSTHGAWSLLWILLLVTFFGIVLFSTLIGIINTAIQDRLEKLRRGHTLVFEEGHTVIFGWSNKVANIIRELAIANESEGKSCIVVHGDRDIIEMEEEIQTRARNLHNTRVVVRSGPYGDRRAPEITSLYAAKSAIILGPDNDTGDIDVIKTLLSFGSELPKGGYCVAEIRDARNLEVAETIGGDGVEYVDVSDLVARLIVHTCRQPGLPSIYEEIIGFSGNEFYIVDAPELNGKTFGEIQLAYDTCVAVGFYDAGKSPPARLNPPMSEVLAEGAKLILLAGDDLQTDIDGIKDPVIDEDAFCTHVEPEFPPDRTLIIGWNSRLPLIVRQLDSFFTKGSSLAVVAQDAVPEDMIEEARESIRSYEEIRFSTADTTSRRALEALDPGAYDEIIILSNTEQMSPKDADAHTLVRLLHLRSILEAEGKEPALISEILDPDNRDLARGRRRDDFIVSDHIVSLVLAQLSEDRRLADVFRVLLESGTAEIFLRPASAYVKPARPVNFYTVAEAVSRRGETAIGYQLNDPGHEEERRKTVLNPRKRDAIPEFREDDCIVLFAPHAGEAE